MKQTKKITKNEMRKKQQTRKTRERSRESLLYQTKSRNTTDRGLCCVHVINDIEIVKICQKSYFAFDLPSVQTLKPTKRLQSIFLDIVLTTQSSDAVRDPSF